MAKPAQSRCHSFGHLRRLLAVRRARAANSKTSICALDHVAALPRLLSNDEAEALAACTACSSCLVSVLPVSSEWWRCVCGVLGTGSSRSPRRSGIRVAPKSRAECHRVIARPGRIRCFAASIVKFSVPKAHGRNRTVSAENVGLFSINYFRKKKTFSFCRVERRC